MLYQGACPSASMDILAVEVQSAVSSTLAG